MFGCYFICSICYKVITPLYVIFLYLYVTASVLVAFPCLLDILAFLSLYMLHHLKICHSLDCWSRMYMSVQRSVHVCVYWKLVVWKDCLEEKWVGISVETGIVMQVLYWDIGCCLSNNAWWLSLYYMQMNMRTAYHMGPLTVLFLSYRFLHAGGWQTPA